MRSGPQEVQDIGKSECKIHDNLTQVSPRSEGTDTETTVGSPENVCDTLP